MRDRVGRREAALIYGAVTVVMLVLALGLYIAGSGKWLMIPVVTLGLDLFVAAIGVVMIAVGRIRHAKHTT